MKLIFIIILLTSQFNQYFSYTEFLEKILISPGSNLTFKFDGNNNVRYKLVEVFSLFNTFDYKYNNNRYTNLNQVNILFKNSAATYTLFVYPSIKVQEIWLRVINITSIEPGDLKVIYNKWSTNINAKSSSFNYLQTDFTYSLYALSIYPEANFLTWSSEFKNIYLNREKIIFDKLNKSIQLEYLKQNGILLYNSTEKPGYINYNVASRINQDLILIIVVNVQNSICIQYPPVYIKGCLSNQPSDIDNCRLIKISFPMYVVMGLTLLFLCLSLYFDLIHILFCGWITAGMITFLIYDKLPFIQVFNDTPIYVISLGIAPAVGLISMAAFYFLTKKYARIRMLFTSFVIGVICISITWFIILKLKTWTYMTLFYVISGIVVFVLVLLFSICNYLTMTMGSVFVSAVIIGLSFSINYLNLSIIPFIFIDFYNSFVFSTSNWIYFSPFLIDDLIIVGLCPLLTLLIGTFVYILIKKRITKKNSSDRRVVPADQSFDTIHLNTTTFSEPPSLRRDNESNVPMFSDPPPLYDLRKTSPNYPLNTAATMPPSYNSCVTGVASPSAPIQPF